MKSEVNYFSKKYNKASICHYIQTQQHERYKFVKNYEHSLVLHICKKYDCDNNIRDKIISYLGNNGCTCNNKTYPCFLCTHACCELAKQRFCMCLVSFTCVKHGYVCVGSHD